MQNPLLFKADELSLCAVMGSIFAPCRRSSAGRELARQEAGLTLPSIPAVTMLDLAEGQVTLSQGSHRCALSPFGVALRVSPNKVLLWPPACSHSRIPCNGGNPVQSSSIWCQ